MCLINGPGSPGNCGIEGVGRWHPHVTLGRGDDSRLASDSKPQPVAPRGGLGHAIWVSGGAKTWPVLLGFVLFAVAGCRDPRAPREPDPTAAHLRVMTYNVNFGLEGDPATVDVIAADDADVILLQETNEAWELALRERLSGRYPFIEFRHCCRAGGLAVLSKYPLGEGDYIEPPDGGWFPGWRLVVDTPLGPLQTLNVHLRPALGERGGVVSGQVTTGPIRRAQMADYATFIEDGLVDGMSTIVVGDFNEGRRGSAVEYLETLGMRTALPEFSGEQNTWRWKTSVGTVHAQLDHIVHDATLDAVDVHVVEGGRSDHLAVVAVFQRSGR